MKKIRIFLFLIFITSCSSVTPTNEIRIQNAQNQDIYIKIDGLDNSKYHKLAIIQHGLASNMNHQAVQAAKKAFLNHHYVVVTFDSRYSLGDGNNDVEKVRLQTFEEDLQTVINWVKQQPYYHEPFALAGHSLGGASVLIFSAQYADAVETLIPITPVISGNLWEKSCMQNLGQFCRRWKQNGTYEYTDPQNHKTAIIPYIVVTDSKTYNANRIAPQIKAETLLIAAQNDIIIAEKDVQKLASSIKNGDSVVINASGHNFETKQNQTDLYQTITTFLK